MEFFPGVFAVVSLMSGSCNLRVTQEIISNNGTNMTSTEVEAISINVVKSLGLAVGLIQVDKKHFLFVTTLTYMYISDNHGSLQS